MVTLNSIELQPKLIAVRRNFTQLDFSTIASFIDSLYSMTGDFRSWDRADMIDVFTEYISDDNAASLIILDNSIICCKFYKMLPSLLGINIGTLYKCKAINGGVVLER